MRTVTNTTTNVDPDRREVWEVLTNPGLRGVEPLHRPHRGHTVRRQQAPRSHQAAERPRTATGFGETLRATPDSGRLHSIGEFSRATHLSVKTLRHYHQIGLLEPANVDPHTGYRSYTTDQISAARVIRRLRELQMPLKRIREILEATDPETRNALISSHLNALQSSLAETKSVVASLRDLLAGAKAQTHEGELDLEGMIERAAFSAQ
jgi:DNA-binding transcriptional MerR regulator